ncbi:hypothetical protein IFU25_08025 [Pantoea agglomerans]|uniref:hypothetical protein n=1 Tax=Enterobacter agglomerans TaxID=549 RepID=UPI00177DAD0B|nr:hypothetical protein [Pantoea agglomerans]MBD8181648.1 hypothetical protein [Pantoea agglomerans]
MDEKDLNVPQEKIAFLFPYNGEAGKENIPPPLLAYDCEELPSEFDLNAGVFFIGLQHKNPYYLEVQVFIAGDNEDAPVSEKRGVWVRVSDSQGHETDIAASIDISLLKCRFEIGGSYFIEATLLIDETPVHKNRAYFRVSKAS